MKRNLIQKIVSTALIMAAFSGCLPQKEEEASQSPDPRPPLMNALSTQASGFIGALNEVVVTGQFFKNVSGENNPEPIAIENEAELNKAIDYLLQNRSTTDNVSTYRPDSRFCSEVTAKNNPSECIKVIEKLSFIQTANDEKSGVLQVIYADAAPVSLHYSPDAVAAAVSLPEVLKAAGRISETMVQNGYQGFADKLPSIAKGLVTFSISSMYGANIAAIGLAEAVEVKGKIKGDRDLHIKAAASQNLLTVSLTKAFKFATVLVNLPQVEVKTAIYDEQNVAHDFELQFPGASGTLQLDNENESLLAQAVKLSSSQIQVKIAGQSAVSIQAADTLDAHLQSYAGGDLQLSFYNAFAASAQLTSNPLFQQNGTLDVAIASQTQVYFSKAAEQAQVVQGSIDIIGTIDLSGNVHAAAGDCLENAENSPIPLQVGACQF